MNTNATIGYGNKLKSVISKTKDPDELLQEVTITQLEAFIKTYNNPDRISCAYAIAELLGVGLWSFDDDVFFMKQATLDLLSFLSTPSINKQFAENSSRADRCAKMLARLVTFFDDLRNKYAQAEMISTWLHDFGCEPQTLERLQQEFDLIKRKNSIR